MQLSARLVSLVALGVALTVGGGACMSDGGTFQFPDGGSGAGDDGSASDDGGIGPGRDGGITKRDLSTGRGDMTQIGPGSVGVHGGSVDLLHFGINGDTRPPSCEDTANYPTAVINAIGDTYRQRNVQFALDLGDHMYVCNNSLPTATAQMNLFMDGVSHYGGTWFMTMGNHECWKGPCLAGSTNANYVAFMNALAPISTTPYYTFDVTTSMGVATFVVIADNAFDSVESAWLDRTLAAADTRATYTIVARHHPEGDSTVTTNPTSMAIVRAHKFALFLSGHTHAYHHMTTDGGRDLVMGNGGAPLVSGGTFNGYGLVDQQANGRLQITVFDVTSGAMMDSWSVGPN